MCIFFSFWNSWKKIINIQYYSNFVNNRHSTFCRKIGTRKILYITQTRNEDSIEEIEIFQFWDKRIFYTLNFFFSIFHESNNEYRDRIRIIYIGKYTFLCPIYFLIVNEKYSNIIIILTQYPPRRRLIIGEQSVAATLFQVLQRLPIHSGSCKGIHRREFNTCQEFTEY